VDSILAIEPPISLNQNVSVMSRVTVWPFSLFLNISTDKECIKFKEVLTVNAVTDETLSLYILITF
jgi:hypothetical protein